MMIALKRNVNRKANSDIPSTSAKTPSDWAQTRVLSMMSRGVERPFGRSLLFVNVVIILI
jgi:hypothetical protein